MTIETLDLMIILNGGRECIDKFKNLGYESDMGNRIMYSIPYISGVEYSEVLDEYLKKHIDDSVLIQKYRLLYEILIHIDQKRNDITKEGLKLIRENEKELINIYDSLYPSLKKRIRSNDFSDVESFLQLMNVVRIKDQTEYFSSKIFGSSEKLRDLLDFYYNKVDVDPIKTSIIENNFSPIRDYCVSHLDKIDEMSTSEIAVFTQFIHRRELSCLGIDVDDLYCKLKNRFKNFEFDESTDFHKNVKLESKGKNFTIFVDQNSDENDIVEEYKTIYKKLNKLISDEEKYRKILLNRYPILSSYPARQKSVISNSVDVVVDGCDTEYTVSEVEYLIGSVPINSSFYTYDEIYGDIVVTNTILITRKDGKPINSSMELEAVTRMYIYKYKGLESADKRVSIYEENKSILSDYIIDPDIPRV